MPTIIPHSILGNHNQKPDLKNRKSAIIDENNPAVQNTQIAGLGIDIPILNQILITEIGSIAIRNHHRLTVTIYIDESYMEQDRIDTPYTFTCIAKLCAIGLDTIHEHITPTPASPFHSRELNHISPAYQDSARNTSGYSHPTIVP